MSLVASARVPLEERISFCSNKTTAFCRLNTCARAEHKVHCCHLWVPSRARAPSLTASKSSDLLKTQTILQQSTQISRSASVRLARRRQAAACIASTISGIR
ncbi:hypothetical protein TGME49_313250 [Toxoplasma gondii ME49]|uniref:Uncharacterized protein n=4 Tax=Toxoplasma gondii TaxID=5811 RepID=B6K912_TOXGV|nr:hypothetical protein TGME49_313250 [Toxoplasma gondii ME49]ESS35084.1 hypothetical protein TGVEG_313250 [Toxoplasma gondii VEG]KYF48331.1 hypothetical protein TGARI_313250 [Toxoplasma gondii ARI]PIM00558.1 hypothetical protein TGCOUG_313250 [Toxoplasma gondii COUG]EPT25941.1 hypothetical protein TGME49_313250 [Toxoplasma gondii ME49]CEL77566.1 TPA: hypothetical protein BN1205_097280 [Toxoplasma gondii VEG]|eukprot:XP_002364536.1 hypothetical protein TGME49_313250 [Toxoplasma gondii ME49]